MGHAKWHLTFSFYSKEIESLTREHSEVLLTLSQITSPRNVMTDVRKHMEVQCLLQTKSKYDSLIRERKAQLGDLDNQVRALGPFTG